MDGYRFSVLGNVLRPVLSCLLHLHAITVYTYQLCTSTTVNPRHTLPQIQCASSSRRSAAVRPGLDLARCAIAYCLDLPDTEDITDPNLCGLGAASVCARLASSVGHCGSDGGADDGEHGEDVELHVGTVVR